jgi:hypothetical protein
LLTSNFEPFLKTGTTFAIFKISGKVPEDRERLKRDAMGVAIISFSIIRRLKGMLFGPRALFP